MRDLSRKKGNRTSLLRNLATSLVLYEKIKTTTAKAKEVKPIVEHLIHIARQQDLAARRRLLSYFFDENAVKKTMDDLAPRYKDIKTGYIEVYKLGTRLGDNADMTLLRLKPAKVAPTPVSEKEEKDGKEIGKETSQEKSGKAKSKAAPKARKSAETSRQAK